MGDVRTAIVGAGGHGRELLGALRRSGALTFAGFVDDREPDRALLERIGAPYLGQLAEWKTDESYVIGIGSGRTRRTIDKSVGTERVAETVVDPGACVGADVELSPGAVVFAFATVTTNIVVGRHTHIGRGAAVGHDSSLGDYVTIMPLAAVSGSVKIGSGATIGAGAVVREGQTIGEEALVGAGAVVVKDVRPGETVVGNPARPIRV